MLSAHSRKSEQSKQALDLHHKLLRVLCCCLPLKPKFPAQGHSSCCTLRFLSLKQVTFSVRNALGHRVTWNLSNILRFWYCTECPKSHPVRFSPPYQQGIQSNTSSQPSFLTPPSSLKQLLRPRMANSQCFSLSCMLSLGRFIKSLHMQLLCENRQYPACSGKKKNSWRARLH